MLDVEWTATRPPLDSIEQLWMSSEFDVVSPEAAAVDRYVDAMADTRASGDARWCCVDIPDSPALDWFASRNCLSDADFFTHLLASDAVTAELTMAMTERPDVAFTVESGLTLDGLLAEQLVHGGTRSYAETIEQEYGTYAAAKRVAERCRDEIIEDRYEEVTIHRTRGAWCDWFGDPHWNMTLVAVDRRYRWAWVVVTTDEGLLEPAAAEAETHAD